MKRISTLVPALFCLEGVLFALRAAQLIEWFGHLAKGSILGLDLQSLWQAYAVNLNSALPVMGFGGVIIAWGLTQRKRWAYRGGLALATLHLAVFPFLFPIGVLMLGLLAKGKSVLFVKHPLARVTWEQKSGERKVPQAYSTIVGLVIAAIGFGAFTLVQYSQTAGFPKLPLLAVPGAIIAAAFLTSVVHELGHAAGSSIAGFQLANLTIGPFWLSRNLSGWHWKFVPNLGWTGALASARPLTDRNLHSNVFLFLAAGPIATLLLGSTSLVLFLSARFAPWALLADGFGILSVVALIDFLSEMSLVRRGHIFTDGARLMQLWNGGMERRRLVATYALGLCETTARRPSDWLPEWLEEPTSDSESPLYFAGCYYSYIYEIDRKNWEKAGNWLTELLGSNVENPSPARRWKAAIEGAYFEALFRDDAVRARHWLSAPKDGLSVEPVSEWRAEAAVHLAEGDLEGCAERILKIRTRLAEVPETGWKAFELALVDHLDRKLNGLPTEGLTTLASAVKMGGNSIQSWLAPPQLVTPSVPV